MSDMALPSTRAERERLARELRDGGLKFREIAERMGLSRSTVNAYITDPGGGRLRARKQGYRGVCVDCGALTDGSAGPRKAAKRCIECWHAQAAERAQERWRPRREQVEALWAEGLTSEEIGLRFGVAPKWAKQFITLCRHRGYNLPHRRSPQTVARLRKSGAVSLGKARAVVAENRRRAT